MINLLDNMTIDGVLKFLNNAVLNNNVKHFGLVTKDGIRNTDGGRFMISNYSVSDIVIGDNASPASEPELISSINSVVIDIKVKRVYSEGVSDQPPFYMRTNFEVWQRGIVYIYDRYSPSTRYYITEPPTTWEDEIEDFLKEGV